MKKKVIIGAILITVNALAVILLIITVTMSWFQKTMERSHEFEVRADGVLYLYIPASVEGTNTSLTPAKAMPFAVANGLYMDVLREYNENDETPSYIEKAAGIAKYSTKFVFFNEYMIKIQARDEYGNLIFDEDGNPVYVQAVDSEGNPIFDEDGNPVYATEPCPATISYDFAIKDLPYEDGNYIDTDEIKIKELYFSYNPEPIADGLPITPANGALPYTVVAQDKTTGSVQVRGTREIYIHMQLYVANVDELIDPALKASSIYIEIKLGVVLEGGFQPD